jgi:alpha-amylase
VPVTNTSSALAANWQRGAFMEIYVRGYNDSDGDGHGDLRGLINKLDYLRDLGITGIWLMPVTRSQDHDHGYAVTDYRDIEVAYGSLADLDELLRQAHARGIGVILDYVMNHSAGQHPLFLNSSYAADNAYRNWYVWQNPAPTGWSIYGGNPWRTSSTGSYFAPFWDQMPDFNLRNTAVVNWHQDNLRFWMNRGVDGFRFDAVGNLVENGPTAWENQPENYTLMRGINTLVAGYSNRYMVCEAPADPQGFGASTACGGAFAFDLQSHVVRAAKGDTAALATVTNYFKTAPVGMATMVSNHDSFAGQRLWDQVAGNTTQYRLAAATYLLLPGTPFVYYGEEVGMAGGANLQGDAALRTPMSWTNDTTRAGFTTGTPFRGVSANVASQNVQAQLADPQSLLSFYKAILNLRKGRPSLSVGSYLAPQVSGTVMAWQRSQGGERSLVLINVGTAAATVPVASLPANARLTELYPGSATLSAADASGNASISVPAQSLRIIDVLP